jgi:PAS domain S-box-containing protein
MKVWDDAPLRLKGFVVIGIPLIPLVMTGALILLGARNAGTANDYMGRANRTETKLSEVLRLAVDDDTAALPQAVAELRLLVFDSPAQLNHVRTIASLVDQLRRTPAVDAVERGATIRVLRTELGAMQSVQDGLIFDRSAQIRRLLVWLAAGGAVFGLLFGILGMRAFVSGVTRRIDRLRAEAGQLARGEPLDPPYGAADELGDLTHSIHDAARLLRARDGEAREHSRTLADVNQQLELARQELDQFFSLSLDLLGIAGVDGRFKRVNAAWERALGWTAAELTSGPYLDFVHPDDREATAAHTAGLARGEVTVRFENRYRATDGSYRWLSWSAVAVMERGLIYVIGRDVTEQKSHSAELAAVNEELEAFSYSVSHDLRAPLRHVTGFASLLQRSAGDRLGEKDARHLRTIVDAAGRMGQLIDDLLAFSRAGRTHIERTRVSLAAVVRDAQADVMRPDVGAPAIAWTVHPLPEVNGDPGLLRQVFVNLLSNAAKYSSTRRCPAVEVGVQSSATEETVIYVRDNGVGFDMAYAGKLFGVFQRLHSSEAFEGTGIGLANVRRIVHRHGGRVWAEGAVDAGATFYFSLPLVNEA